MKGVLSEEVNRLLIGGCSFKEIYDKSRVVKSLYSDWHSFKRGYLRAIGEFDNGDRTFRGEIFLKQGKIFDYFLERFDFSKVENTIIPTFTKPFSKAHYAPRNYQNGDTVGKFRRFYEGISFTDNRFISLVFLKSTMTVRQVNKRKPYLIPFDFDNKSGSSVSKEILGSLMKTYKFFGHIHPSSSHTRKGNFHFFLKVKLKPKELEYLEYAPSVISMGDYVVEKFRNTTRYMNIGGMDMDIDAWNQELNSYSAIKSREFPLLANILEKGRELKEFHESDKLLKMKEEVCVFDDRPKIADFMVVEDPRHFVNGIRGERNPSCFLVDEYSFVDAGDGYSFWYVAFNRDLDSFEVRRY